MGALFLLLCSLTTWAGPLTLPRRSQLPKPLRRFHVGNRASSHGCPRSVRWRAIKSPGTDAARLGTVAGLPWRESIAGKEHELFYMPFVEKIIGRFREEGIELVEVDDVDASFLYQESKPGAKSPARVGCMLLKSKGGEFRRIRVEYLDAGPKAQILNCLFYPSFDREIPLLGIDLLSFAEGTRLLVGVDYFPLSQDPAYLDAYTSGLREIKKRYPELNQNVSSKIYDSFEFFSPNMLFGRFSSASELESRILPAVDQAVSEYIRSNLRTPQNVTGEGEDWVRERQSAYNRYNHDNDPAAGVFVAYFGKEWSERFVKEFLFELG
mmetsp:Transcript_32825/g.63330  ORF Transcript_32825/g.63330 Transcript_32825/m.63330 type:complete len:324 (-) Transcript_32825:803-1774(-)